VVNKYLSRRDFVGKSIKYGVGGSLLLLSGLSIAGCSPFEESSARQAEHIVKIGLIDPDSHPHVEACKRFAELVHEKTNNEVKVEIYPSSQLGDASTILQGLQHGTVEAFFGAVTWLGANITDFWLPGTLYLFNDQEHCRNVHEGPEFKKLAEQAREKEGIRVFSMGYDRGPRHFISTNPIKGFEDLEGLKIRVPAQLSWVRNFEMAGAAPQAIALSETFTALQQGIVQATEQASNWLYFNSYYTIANNITKTHHNYEQSGFFFSDLIFDTYPADVKQVLQDTAEEIIPYHNDLIEKDIKTSEDEMKKENIDFHEINLEEWQSHFRELIPGLSKEVGYSMDLVNNILNNREG